MKEKTSEFPEQYAEQPYKAPKKWVELTADEKIDRLREEVKSKQWQLNSAISRLNTLEHKFFKHDHDPRDGKLITEIDRYSTADAGQAYLKVEEGYF